MFFLVAVVVHCHCCSIVWVALVFAIAVVVVDVAFTQLGNERKLKAFFLFRASEMNIISSAEMTPQGKQRLQ